jgi:cobalt-zinc-cadmium efflux system protein
MEHHGHNHTHDHAHHQSMDNLKTAFWINSVFVVIEIVGGIMTNSVAILSDALHDLGDSLSLGLAHYFEKKSARRRDAGFSYGYKRFSLLGAFINSLVLIIGSVFILRESAERLWNPEPFNAKGMFFLAVLGIGINLVAMLRLKMGSSINERVLSVHFLEDVLGWAAVLAGSVVMMFYDAPLLDPVLSILIALFILFNVYKNLRKALPILLQGIPDNVDLGQIRQKIMTLPGVLDVHDVHTWTMDGQYNVMTIHVVIADGISMRETDELKHQVRNMLEPLNIQHLTIETELAGNPCVLKEC